MNKLKKLNILLFILNIVVFICICFFIPKNTKISKNDLQKKNVNADLTYVDYFKTVNVTVDGQFYGNNSFHSFGKAYVHVYDYNNNNYDTAFIDGMVILDRLDIVASGNLNLTDLDNPTIIYIAPICDDEIIMQKLDKNLSSSQFSIYTSQYITICSMDNLVLQGQTKTMGEITFEGENITIEEYTTIPTERLVFQNNNTIIKDIGHLTSGNIEIKTGTIKSCEYKVESYIDNLQIGQDVTIEAGALCNIHIGNINLSDNKYYSLDDDGILSTKDKSRLIYYMGKSDLTSYKVPRTVTTIDDGAFLYSYKLENMTIPKNVTNIGTQAINTSVNILCKSGTAAKSYAESNRVPYTLDDISPTVTFATNGISTPTKTANTKVTVSETGSGLYGNIYYAYLNKSSGVTEAEVKNAKTTLTSGSAVSKTSVTGDYYLYVYTEDYVGNTNLAKSNVFKIDNTVPTLSVDYSKTTPTNQDVIATITSDEQLQTVAGWELSTDKLKLTKTYKSNTSESGETVTVKDLAENPKSITVKVTNIDKIAPKLEISYLFNVPNKNDITVVVTSNEQVQNVEGWSLSTDNLSLSKVYTRENIKIGEKIKILDLAGNEKEINIKLMHGDINLNGKIDVVDVLRLQRNISAENNVDIKEKNPGWILEGEKRNNGDINGNGYIDINDIQVIQRHIAAINDSKIAKIHPEWIIE